MPDGRDHIVLAFDFGLRRIGIASGNTVSGTAAPRAVVRHDAAGADWVAIDRLLRQFQPGTLVVGSPLHADGSASARSTAADRFAIELARRAGLDVHRVDEFNSSREATERLRARRQTGLRRRRVARGDVDSAAAVIILERWLQSLPRAAASHEIRMIEQHD